MRFSIVIPLYNKATYIQATIASVLAQSFTDFEIVIIDDGSKDAGPDLVSSLSQAENRIRIIRQANSGVSKARNKGIQEAHGEWVVFLDADDCQHPQYLATLQHLINQYPLVDVVATKYKSIPDTQGKVFESWDVLPLPAEVEMVSDLPTRWLKGPTLFTGSIAVRASLLHSMQPCFPEGESAGEDLDLWFRLAEKGPIALCVAPLVARIWVPDGLSVVHQARLEAPFLLRMEQRAASGTLPHALSKSTQAFVDESRITLARSAIAAGDRRLALRLLWRGKTAAGRPRWWVTLGMSVLIPAPTVHRWQQWRKRRKMSA